MSVADLPEVPRRVMRQLIESLVYEGAITSGGVAGDGVAYCWTERRRFSFDRVRVGPEPVVRIRPGEALQEAISPRRFLDDIGPALAADPDRRTSFATELLQTVVNDTAARQHWRQAARPATGAGYDELESLVVDGHRYHPSYKSRLGFNAVDNAEYGPEFGRLIRPVWVAVRRDLVQCSSTAGAEPERLGEHVVLPVHPWQFRKHAPTTWAPLLVDGALVPLGAGKDEYRAQQSIRSLANVSRPDQPTLKLALSIVNTSTARTLAPHTVANAPLITGWLQRIAAGDPYLRERRPVLLGERLGVVHSPELAAIWRDSIHPYLAAEEQAAPFTALTHVDATGEPFIAPWVKEHGLEPWLRRLLEVTVTPVLHFLVAHGIALEAHAQNLILVHVDGRPRRLALRDFHDGIRFSVAGLADPDGRPALQPTPPEHFRVNRNSYLEAQSDEEVRDFVHDCLFFVNLAELAMFIEDRFDLPEERFWSLARRVVEDHRRRFPELAERAARFDVLAPEVSVEQLTTRRLLPDTEVRLQRVRNPLSLVDAD
ncbi:MAG: IucA/IucC family protein [Actinomycetota bacterium]|jgi:2-[(L-alanin-3-ylcarbamoyl)methyl]-3-(2-aminoethylcarbamoyl)-2-hydroxypropanoate synthase